MKVFKGFSLSVLAALLVVLSACSSVETPRATTPGTTTPGAEDQNAQFRGIVGGSSDSLSLNGQSLNVSNAAIALDDETITALDLQPGMEVEVSGKDKGDALDAERVEARTRVKGQVDAVSEAGLEVVGLQVITDENTLVVNLVENEETEETEKGPVELGDIAVEDYVMVFGVAQEDNSVLATLILKGPEDNKNKVEFRAKASKVDVGAKTFSYGLGTHTVSFADADVRGEVADGVMVRVRGTREGTTITAERVTSESRKPWDEEEENEEGEEPSKGEQPNEAKIVLGGVTSGFNAEAKTFNIFDLTVNYAEAEVKGELKDDAWVHIEGAIDFENKVIVAKKVKVNERNCWDGHPGKPERPEHPEHPNHPNPGQPGEPEDPEKPEQPENPEGPEKPENPEQPENPEEEPATPEDSATPENPSEPETPKEDTKP
ncbi:MAG: DUF5666 domain-containing protein [Trueperaceae bacterium]